VPVHNARYSLSVEGHSMKRFANGSVILKLIAIGMAALLYGCDKQPDLPKTGAMEGAMHVPPASNPDQVHHAVGIVREMDAGKSTVVVTSEAIESLKWPAMTMPFVVKDKALLDKFSVNKNVSFDFKQVGSEFVVIAVN
jgi:Cu(I)/Ag(I) efflux system periplasmic protein CusF